MTRITRRIAHILASAACRARYGRNCPHLLGIGSWYQR